jgi:hypothetical protein
VARDEGQDYFVCVRLERCHSGPLAAVARPCLLPRIAVREQVGPGQPDRRQDLLRIAALKTVDQRLTVLSGDGKEKRKIPVISLQTIDLPITDDTVLRGDSKAFLTAFFWHKSNGINDFDCPIRL